MLGEILGLFMLANFLAMSIIWEFKKGWLDNAVLTCGLRLVIATLTQEILMTLVYYIRGLEQSNLSFVMQINAGNNLLSNLLLFVLLLAWLRIRGSGRVEAALEAKQ